jgi:phage terminase large subunit-like protein
MGPIAFSTQYQQAPIPPGGTYIKREWLTPYDTIGQQPGDRLIMSWDIALSETETGDYSACVVLLMRKEVFYILEVVRGRSRSTLKRKVMESRTLQSGHAADRGLAHQSWPYPELARAIDQCHHA